MLIALRSAGISGERTANGSGKAATYSVKVNRSELGRSFEVLHEYRLPRTDEESFETLTGGDDLIPNVAAMAQLRLDRALALELEHGLALLPGIADVRVVLRSHLVAGAVPSLPTDGKPVTPTASVFIRYVARSGNQPFSVDDIRQRVVDSVPGLAAERVSVTASRVVMSTSDTTLGREEAGGPIVQLSVVEPFSILVPEQDHRRVLQVIAGLLLMFSLTSGVVGWAMAGWFEKRKVGPGGRVVKSAVLEASYSQGGRPTGSATNIPVTRPGPPPKSRSG